MAGKIILGLLFLITGAWLLLPLQMGLPYQGAGWDEFLMLLKGVVPAFMIFLGALIIWIESEDMKARRVTRK